MRRLRSSLRRAFYFGFDFELSFISWFILTLNGKKLPQYNSKTESGVLSSKSTGALEYSQQAFSRHRPHVRSRLLLLFLASLPRQTSSRLLIVGPRFESEIFFARGLGWKKQDIYALDLLTYSTRVTRGDMHNTNFPSDFFGSIVVPWTISYSLEPHRVASEMARILEPGGVVVLGVDFVVSPNQETLSVLKGIQRVQSRKQFSELFQNFDVIYEADRHNDEQTIQIALRKSER